ncbi:MAG TPA: TonB-dependent receptor [Rhodothermales bacterium]|nr:TonB-dependent receptor [Rhodothermales bacterium]
MRLRPIVLLFLIVAALFTRTAQGQSVRIHVDDVPLEQGLQLLQSQTGIDLVYARRLVDDLHVTCHYSGSSSEEALACLLRESPLRYEVVRHRQYVLIPGGDASGPPPVSRGVISGFLADAATGEMLPGAQIYVPALQLGTVANPAGYFAIPNLPIGSYRVRLSYVGYQTALIALSVNEPARVHTLHAGTVQAREVVVEGERLPDADLAPASGVTRVPTQILDVFPAFPGERDLFQSLKWLPGVQKPGELSGSLVVRGGETDENEYLLDGVPIYHPWHAFNLISTFQTETLKDVRLYRTVFPAEYGGRLSSVLDTQLKDGSRTGPGGVAALSLLSGRIMVETPVTRTSSLMVSARRSYIDQLTGRIHPVVGEDGRRDTLRTGYHFYDLSGKFTLRQGLRHRLSVSYYQGRDLLDLRLPFDVSLDFSSWLRPADLYFEVDQDWGNRLGSIHYQYLYSPRLFATVTAYYSGYHALEGAFIQPTTTSTLQSRYRVRLRDLGTKLDVDWYAGVAHQVRTGAELVQHQFHSTLDAVIDRSVSAIERQNQASDLSAWEVNAYIQDVWQPSPRWQVVPGVRASLFGRGRFVSIDPNVSVRYAVDPRYLAFRASAGTQVQYMHRLRDRYSYMYDLVSSRWIPSGPGVAPSSSWGLEAGVESRPAPWLTLSSEVYWRHSRNVLLPEDVYQTKNGLEGPGIELGTLLGQYTTARARAYGIDLSASLKRPPWHVWATYSGGRSFTHVPASGESGYYPSRYDVPRSFQGLVNFARGHWEGTVALEMRSGYPTTVPVSRYVIGDPLDPTPDPYLHRPYLNNGRLPPYLRVDVSGAYRFSLVHADWQLRLIVYNVLDHRNVVSRQYDPAQTIVRPEDRHGLPLLPLLELVVRV